MFIQLVRSSYRYFDWGLIFIIRETAKMDRKRKEYWVDLLRTLYSPLALLDWQGVLILVYWLSMLSRLFSFFRMSLVFSDYSTSNSLFHFRHPQSKVYSWYLTLINRIRIARFYSLFESLQTILLCSRCIHRSIVLDSCSNGSWTRVWRMLLQMIL